jgi:hypothetical protein
MNLLFKRQKKEARLAELDEGSAPATVVPFANRDQKSHSTNAPSAAFPIQISFNRQELGAILKVYGRNVAAGEWRDYAIDQLKDKAVFSIFRRSSEFPLFRVEKTPKLARKQGQYAVVAPTGMILKRGADLEQVLKLFDKKLRLID